MPDDRRGIWLMRQTWSPTLFVHWQVPDGIVRPLLPEALRLDTWQGSAWVSLVVVGISRTRPRGLPPVPGTGAYRQLNLRTYVTHEGRPGLYFFGAYLTKGLPALAQSIGFGVRARRVRMEMQESPSELRLHVEPSGNNQRGLSLHAVLDGEPRYTREGTVDAWLHERYRAYAQRGRNIVAAEVRHRPWLLTNAHLDELSGGFDDVPVPLREPSLVRVGAQADTRLLLPHRVGRSRARTTKAEPVTARRRPA